MKRFIHDKKNGLDYELVGDYYLPCLKAPESPKVGRFGMMYHDYLRKYKRITYSGLLLSDKLEEHIEEVDRLLHYANGKGYVRKKELSDTMTELDNLEKTMCQTFKPGEVDANKAHQIGLKLARYLCGDNFEVLVATHISSHCIQTHINKGRIIKEVAHLSDFLIWCERLHTNRHKSNIYAGL